MDKEISRRVVSGLDQNGRSTVTSDGHNPSHVETPAFTIEQIWQVDSLPAAVLADDSSGGAVSITPPQAGFVYLVTTFPPDSSWDLSGEYAASLAASGGGGAEVESEIPGMHQTDTLDIITVISGELHAVFETGEVCLRPGESFVQRGTRHTWSNRTDAPCKIVAVMAGAVR
ncbi:MAG: cupin domain-containing protein [Paracoccus sp. (in: a-proteobacteria)]